jgi:hypothetical protein
VEQKLRLNEFKAIYDALETGTVWVDHLLFGLLVWLEDKLIEKRSQLTVDEAIKEWESLQGELSPTQSDDVVSPVYTEKPSDTSTRLPEMRLTAPWYVETYDEK